MQQFSGKRDLYLEIAEKYENYIKLGILLPGEKLPSVRAAAAEHGVNPNTMARAYGELEARGLIKSIPKKGVYVEAPDGESRHGEPSETYTECRELLRTLKERGLSRSQIESLVKEVFTDYD